MMLCWILISLYVGFIKAQESPIVIYAQVGGIVTLPRYTVKENAENVYVNWYRGLDENPTISRNPQSGIQKGREMKTHANLLEDFSLQISPVQDSDFEIWRCVQHVLMATSERTYKLYHVTIPKVPAVLVGASLSLECKVDSSSVNPTVTWIPPENDCNLSKLKTETINIEAVSWCHSGLWTCNLKYGNNRRETKATTTVSVIDFSLFPDTIYTSSLSSYSTVDIPCSLYSKIPWSVLNETGLSGGSWSFTPLSDPKSTQSLLSLSVDPVVRWDVVKGTDSIPTVEGRELKDQDLSIRNLRVSEKIRGVYNCSLMFKSKTLSRKVTVEVLKGCHPRCSCISFFSRKEIKVFVENIPVDFNWDQRVERSKFSAASKGIYTIPVSSSGGSRLYEGQSVNLTCTLGHQHTSDLEVKWNCSSCSIFSSLKTHPSTLFIPEVKVKDSGKYTCELWKKGAKLTSAVLSLKIERAPVNIWLWVAIIGGVVGFILLLVIVIICIRRHRQMMMYRRRKTKFCCCKTPQQNQKGFYKT